VTTESVVDVSNMFLRVWTILCDGETCEPVQDADAEPEVRPVAEQTDLVIEIGADSDRDHA
jgi:hypothetical protein